MKPRDYAWTALGLGAAVVSVWLLYHELSGISLRDVVRSLDAIRPRQWVLAVLSTALAYAALAGYDRVALRHLGRTGISWTFVALCSFTTYALAHNIGASVMSGAVVRFRAYRTKGLSPAEVAVLVAFCSLTFALGVALLGGLVLVLEPGLLARFLDDPAPTLARGAGIGLLALVGLYAVASRRDLRPLKLAGTELRYPRREVVLGQLLVGPVELIGAAGIIYFALPEIGNPGFLAVLGIFLASFSAALISHAPGGIGVLEVVFLVGLSEMDPADVLAALLVFRLLYLLIPFALSIVVILVFERVQFARALSGRREAALDDESARGR